ncbi:MAG: VOC family protein, partial [Sphingomonadaceae bacterium]
MPPLERLYQTAFVVEALEPAIQRWVATANAGPFFVFDPFAFEDPRLDGISADPGIAIALGFSGDLFVELIEARGTGPSVFEGTSPGALHHVARLSADVDATLAALAAQGAPTRFRARFAPGIAMGFADTRAQLGCWTEVIEATPDVAGLLDMMRA